MYKHVLYVIYIYCFMIIILPHKKIHRRTKKKDQKQQPDQMYLTVHCHSLISLDSNGGFHVYSLNIAKATLNSLSQPRLLDSFLYLSLKAEYRLNIFPHVFYFQLYFIF